MPYRASDERHRAGGRAIRAVAFEPARNWSQAQSAAPAEVNQPERAGRTLALEPRMPPLAWRSSDARIRRLVSTQAIPRFVQGG
jgi:hypothetical protein